MAQRPPQRQSAAVAAIVAQTAQLVGGAHTAAQRAVQDAAQIERAARQHARAAAAVHRFKAAHTRARGVSAAEIRRMQQNPDALIARLSAAQAREAEMLAHISDLTQAVDDVTARFGPLKTRIETLEAYIARSAEYLTVLSNSLNQRGVGNGAVPLSPCIQPLPAQAAGMAWLLGTPITGAGEIYGHDRAAASKLA